MFEYCAVWYCSDSWILDRLPLDPITNDLIDDEVPLFVVGAISPLFGNNPSFTTWIYDQDTYDLLDFTVHGSNISESTEVSHFTHRFNSFVK